MVRMAERTDVQATNFNAIRISIASPEQMLNWSHGEVTKPETINYRTLSSARWRPAHSSQSPGIARFGS